MEGENKNKIAQNLSKLIDVTICSSKFLSIFTAHNVFSKIDTEMIEAEGKNYGQSTASKIFYDLLLTRSGSFEVLQQALRETSQSGAAKILETADVEAATSTSGTISSPVIRFSKAPNYIPKFTQGNQDILIISSIHNQLTCDWISESTDNCQSFSQTEFLECISKPNAAASNTIRVVNIGENLETLQLLPTDQYSKTIFVTNQTLDNAIRVNLTVYIPENIKWELVYDELQWNDLSPQSKFLISCGLKKSLGLTQSISFDTLAKINNGMLAELVQNTFPKPENLFLDTIPKALSYYVPRTLITRNVLTEDILRIRRDNIVLVIGIERHALSELIGDALTDTSGNILRTKHITCSFVVLEHEAHYEAISGLFPENPVHLLKYNGKNFVWQGSSQAISNIQKFVSPIQHSITEDNFFTHVTNQISRSPVCISDTPGMGKSVLLTKIAMQLKTSQDGLVAFVVINELIRSAKNISKESDTTSALITAISKYLSESVLGEVFIKANPSYLRELVLDGFDEIDADYVDFAFKCIKEIRKAFKETRIWITTRPHMLHELERNMDVLGYTIMPFSEANQIKFLTSYWGTRISISHCREKLVEFAKECLTIVKTSLNKTQEDIAGVPLQCHLIGEVYEADAKLLFQGSLPPTSITPPISLSVTSLYGMLIEKKIANFESKYNFSNLKRLDVRKAHIQMALRLLYPKYEAKFVERLRHSLSMQEIFDNGIIEAQSVLAVPRFIHRTFAEYFVALFIRESVSINMDETVSEFIFNDILKIKNQSFAKSKVMFRTSVFSQNVICHFVNTLLPQLESINMHERFRNHVSNNLQTLSTACLFHDLENIFTNLLFNLHFTSELWTEIFDTNFLVVAVNSAGLKFLRIILAKLHSLNVVPLPSINILKEKLEYNIDESDNEAESDDSYDGITLNREAAPTLLHVAASRGDFSIVEFLLTKYFRTSVQKNHAGRYDDLIHWCVKGTRENSDWEIAERKQIINLFSSINTELLVSEDNQKQFPLERGGFNLELVKTIFKLSGNKYTKLSIIIRLLHNNYRQLPSKEYLVFVKFLFEKTDECSLKNICTLTYRGKSLLQQVLSYKEADANFLDSMQLYSKGSFCLAEDTMAAFERAADQEQYKTCSWLIQNVPYTADEIRILLEFSINYFKIGAVDVIVEFLQEKVIVDKGEFCDLFEFLILGKSSDVVAQNRCIMDLIGYFLFKTNFNEIFISGSRLNLSNLIRFGIICLDEVHERHQALQIELGFLKLIWYCRVYEGCENSNFITHCKQYLMKTDLKVKDKFGNNLLHIAAQYFSHKVFIDRFKGLVKIGTEANKEIVLGSRSTVKGRENQVNFWKISVELCPDILEFNSNKQTPICLLSQFGSDSSSCETILHVLSRYLSAENINFAAIHTIVYLVFRSHSSFVVTRITEWYIDVCKRFDIDISDVRVSLWEAEYSLLDAAVQSANVWSIDHINDNLRCKTFGPLPNDCIQKCLQDNSSDSKIRFLQFLRECYPTDIQNLVNQPDENSLVPLSSKGVTTHCIRLLIEMGANANSVDINGNSPLHLAIDRQENGFSNVASELIISGSNVNAENNKEETPLFILVKKWKDDSFIGFLTPNDHLKCFKILVDNNADLSKIDSDGNTILHVLIGKLLNGASFHFIVQIIVSKGCLNMIQIVNDYGETPLEMADKAFSIKKVTKELLRRHKIVDITSTTNS